MSQPTLGAVFGFTADDLKANRRGKFSTHQQHQMNAVVRNTVRPLLIYGGAFTVVAVVTIILLNVSPSAFGQFLSVILSFMLMLLLLVGGGMAVMLTRLRNRMRVVNRHTGTLRRHITGDGTLHISVDDLAFQAQVTDVHIAQDLLDDGAQYAVYFMGVPPVASLLSLERKSG